MKLRGLSLLAGALMCGSALAAPAYNPSAFAAPPSVVQSIPLPTLTMVTPEMYGALADGTTDDHVAFQAALNSGYPVWLAEKGKYFLGTLGVKTTTLQPIIYGNNAVLSFAGNPASNTTGCAIDMLHNADPWFTYFSIITTGSGASSAIADRVKALCVRSQNGYYNSIFVSAKGNHSEGYYLAYDAATTSNVYYNTFENLNFTGNLGSGGTDNQPFFFETGPGVACGIGPNANQWHGGNLSSYDTPGELRGSRNEMITTFQGWAASTSAVVANLGVGCAAGTANYGNLLGGYFEGDRTGQTAIQINGNVSELAVMPSFFTSLATIYTDNGIGTKYIAGRTGTFTPTLTDGTNHAVYAASGQNGQFSTSDEIVNATLSVQTTAISPVSGAVSFCGLPFPVVALGLSSSGGGSATKLTGVTLDSGYTWVTVEAVLATSCVILWENGSNKTPQQLTSSNFSAASTTALTFNYRRY